MENEPEHPLCIAEQIANHFEQPKQVFFKSNFRKYNRPIHNRMRWEWIKSMRQIGYKTAQITAITGYPQETIYEIGYRHRKRFA
jgi:hypothetical protein